MKFQLLTSGTLSFLLMASVPMSTALLVTSCAGLGEVRFVTPGQPYAEVRAVAISKEAFAGRSSRTYVRKVKGTGVENPWAIFHVPPGVLRLSVENRENTLSSQAEITFNAKAGRSYVVKSDQAVGMKVKFWVEDEATNSEVAAVFSKLEISDEKLPKPPLVVPIFIPVN